MDFETILAERTKTMKASMIREILKVLERPGVISLAGGLPAPASFPLHLIPELTEKVIEKYESNAFQYSLTEGFIPLREALVPYLKTRNITTTMDDILITSGSQGLLDQVGKIFISEGDTVAVEAPTYLAAIQAFNPYGAKYITIATDDDGCIPEALEEIIKNNKIKFVYLIPTFQNPTGRTITLERRKQIANIIQKYNMLLIEDDPYCDLRYRGTPIPPIQTLAPEIVIYATTLSKVFAPGLRIGITVVPKSIHKWLVFAKQGIDLHTSTFNLALAAEYISSGYLAKHLPEIIKLYKPKQETMLRALDTYFPDSYHYIKPEGGMFIWVDGPAGTDMEDIYWNAIDNKVAFVPGKYFFTNPKDGIETMRLNYTMPTNDALEAAIKRLSEVLPS